MATTIGCGSYEVFALDRGGRNLLTPLPWTSLTWSRVLDDTSEAQISLDLLDPICCGLLAELRPWRHEISVYRDGAEVWVGPVYIVDVPAEQYQVQARDVTAWWDRRLIHDDHTYLGIDLATIFEELSADAMAPDTSPGLTVATSPTGIPATQTYLGSQHQVAGLILRDLSNIGVDWTAVRRTVLAGGTTVPADPIGLLEDEHFRDPPEPRRDGSMQRNRSIVRGNGGGAAGDSIFGDADNPVAIAADGLLEETTTVSTVTDNTTAKAAAQTRVQLRKEIVLIGDCVLAPSAPLTVEALIPGAVVSMRLAESCVPVADVYRLQKIEAAVDAATAVERITLSVQPLGTT